MGDISQILNFLSDMIMINYRIRIRVQLLLTAEICLKVIIVLYGGLCQHTYIYKNATVLRWKVGPQSSLESVFCIMIYIGKNTTDSLIHFAT